MCIDASRNIKCCQKHRKGDADGLNYHKQIFMLIQMANVCLVINYNFYQKLKNIMMKNLKKRKIKLCGFQNYRCFATLYFYVQLVKGAEDSANLVL